MKSLACRLVQISFLVLSLAGCKSAPGDNDTMNMKPESYYNQFSYQADATPGQAASFGYLVNENYAVNTQISPSAQTPSANASKSILNMYLFLTAKHQYTFQYEELAKCPDGKHVTAVFQKTFTGLWETIGKSMLLRDLGALMPHTKNPQNTVMLTLPREIRLAGIRNKPIPLKFTNTNLSLEAVTARKYPQVATCSAVE